MKDCPSNIPTIYYYDYWRDIAAAEIQRRSVDTKQNRSVLDQHLEEIADHAEDSDNSEPEHKTLLENLDSVYDCQMDCFDSELVLAHKLSRASKDTGKKLYGNYQFTRKRIVAQWLLVLQQAVSKGSSPKEKEDMVKDRMPDSVWEIYHFQRLDKSTGLIREMSENSTFSVLCNAYDEHIQNFSVKRLEERRDVLRQRAMRMKRFSRSTSKEYLEKELVALGRKQLQGFLPPANAPKRSNALDRRADYSYRKMHVLGNPRRSPDRQPCPSPPKTEFTWGHSSSKQESIPRHDWDNTSNGAGAQDKK